MQDDKRDDGKRPATSNSASPDVGSRVIDVQQVLNGNDTVGLRHNGELYRLRVTSKGRLILTK